MKIATILFFLLYLNFTNAQSLFEKTNIVDEFGDKVGEVQSNIAFGTFSNSATNDSKLRVQTVLKVTPEFENLDDYKNYLRQELKEKGSSEKEIKTTLKYAKKIMERTKNNNGSIEFKLFEYNNQIANMIGIEKGIISIKTSDGKKIKANLSTPAFSEGKVTITGYKEITTGASGVKNQIKFGFYDWNQSEIYNEIVNSKDKIMVVIAFGSSTYKFTLE